MTVGRSLLSIPPLVGLSRIWLSLGLVVSLTAALLVGLPSPAGAVAGYGDVGEGTWYTDAVQWSTDNGIADISGFCFGPGTAVSRGETAVWIYNMENQPDAGDPHSFTDVTDASQNDAISWMANNAITTGTSPTTFAPDETLTRAQAATFLHRLNGKPTAPQHNFSDVVAGWQQDGVSWMAHTGITTGTSPTTFAPEGTLTRAHLVTFLYRYQGKPAVTLNTTTPHCAPEQTVEQTVGQYNTGDTIAGFPSGFAAFSGNFSGASVKTTGSAVTVEIIRNGSAAYSDTTYACESVGGCTIVNGRVTKGTVNATTVTVGAEPAPDLVVGSPTVDASAPVAGERFTLSATVRNQGDGRSASTTLRYYQSVDATITTADTEVGTDSVFGLDALESGAESISVTAPSTPGTYYFGACVDSVSDESDTTNNCSTAVTVTVDTLTGGFKTVSADRYHSCGIRSDGTAVCWGGNLSGQADAPTGGFKTVSAGGWHSCGIRSDGTAVCWGNNLDGRADAPTGGFKTVSAGRYHSCGIRSDGTAVCWGSNLDGQADAPTGGFKTVSAGGWHSCGIRSDGTAVCWGSNSDGQADAPTGGFKTVSAGRYHSCGIRSDGTAVCWGSNLSGQADAPTGGFKTVSAGGWHSCGIRSDGTAVCWGNNLDGRADAPTGGFKTVSAGRYHSCGIRSDGTAVCWGSNSHGQTDAPTEALAALVVEPVAGTSTELEVQFEDFIGVGETRAYDFAIRESLGGSWVEVCRTFSNTGRAATATFSQGFTGLEPGTTYEVRYRYRNSSRCRAGSPSEWSSIAQGTTNDDDEAPAAPMVEPSAGTSTELEVQFEDFIGVGETRAYDFAVRAILGGSWVEACNTFSNTSGRAVTATFSQGFTGLEPGTIYAVRYRYRNSSRCGAGSPGEWSPIAQGTTNDDEAPAAPMVEPSAGTSTELEVQFEDFIGVGETRAYDFAVRAISGGSWVEACNTFSNTSGQAATATITQGFTGLEPGTIYAVRYRYRNSSRCGGGSPGEWSPIAQGTTNDDEAPAAPDLVVDTPTVSTSSPPAGERFTLSATVRNQGDGPSASTTLRYYRSVDATITTGDTEVGTDIVSGLDALESGAESINVAAPSVPGTYYFGACVDSEVDESDTTNNCSVAVTVTVGAASPPDLVVDTPTVSDSNPPAPWFFWLSATVRNQGDGRSGSTTVRFFRSTDATITTGDTEVGTDIVSGLDPQESGPEWISLNAPSVPGTYYFGACVDSVSDESDATNNCSVAVTVTVTAPDLVVDTPTVSNSNPIAGASFTLNVTVRNQGDGPSASTTLFFYRSTDSTITTGDTRVGGTPLVSSLDAQESESKSVVDRGLHTPGTYYYGACVNSVWPESDTTNNCSDSVTVTVGAALPPDLVVDSLTVSNSSPIAGAFFTLSATVRNQGHERSASTTLRYYQSVDATITTGDMEVGTDSVFRLVSLETADELTRVTAPSVPGTYYFGACVDSVSDESDTTNNCSDSVTVTVGAAPTPDLVVGSLTVSDSNPVAGASFTLSATVRNRGDGRSGSTTLRYYRSVDGTITTGDTEVGTDIVSGLDPQESGAESISVTASSVPGTYYFGACVDSVSDESDTTNNCSDSVTVTVGAAPTLELLGDCQDDMKLQVGQGCNYQGIGASEQQITVLLSVRNDGAICREGGPITEEVFGIPITVDNVEKCDLGGFERDDTFGSDITVEKNTDGSWTFHDS